MGNGIAFRVVEDEFGFVTGLELGGERLKVLVGDRLFWGVVVFVGGVGVGLSEGSDWLFPDSSFDIIQIWGYF